MKDKILKLVRSSVDGDSKSFFQVVREIMKEYSLADVFSKQLNSAIEGKDIIGNINYSDKEKERTGIYMAATKLKQYEGYSNNLKLLADGLCYQRRTQFREIDEIITSDENKDKIKYVIDCINSRCEISSHGLRHLLNVAIVGPKGNGQDMILDAISTYTSSDIFEIRNNMLVSGSDSEILEKFNRLCIIAREHDVILYLKNIDGFFSNSNIVVSECMKDLMKSCIKGSVISTVGNLLDYDSSSIDCIIELNNPHESQGKLLWDMLNESNDVGVDYVNMEVFYKKYCSSEKYSKQLSYSDIVKVYTHLLRKKIIYGN